jgi:hypothetical protein
MLHDDFLGHARVRGRKELQGSRRAFPFIRFYACQPQWQRAWEPFLRGIILAYQVQIDLKDLRGGASQPASPENQGPASQTDGQLQATTLPCTKRRPLPCGEHAPRLIVSTNILDY